LKIYEIFMVFGEIGGDRFWTPYQFLNPWPTSLKTKHKTTVSTDVTDLKQLELARFTDSHEAKIKRCTSPTQSLIWHMKLGNLSELPSFGKGKNKKIA
jgi:hypothetical protein